MRPGVSSGSFLVSVFSGVRRQVGSGVRSSPGVAGFSVGFAPCGSSFHSTPVLDTERNRRLPERITLGTRLRYALASGSWGAPWGLSRSFGFAGFIVVLPRGVRALLSSGLFEGR